MSTNSPRRTGFTLVELLVVIGIIALLVGILLPALSKARYHAGLVKCASNLHQIGIAANLYEANYKGQFEQYLGPMTASAGVYYGQTGRIMDPQVTDWWSWPNTPKILRKIDYGNAYAGSAIGMLAYVHEGYLKDTRVFYCPLDPYRQPTAVINYTLMYANKPAYDRIKVNSVYEDPFDHMITTSYDFNPIQTSKARPIMGTRVWSTYGNSSTPFPGSYPFDGMNPNDAPLALDLLQSPKDNSNLGDAGGGESHPGDWNVLRFDGSVNKVNSPALVKRQALNSVLYPSGNNAWVEYEIELQNYIIGKF